MPRVRWCLDFRQIPTADCLFFSPFSFFLSDVDECAADRSLCQPYGSCENRPGSYMCVCNHGYVLSEDKHSCERKLAPIPSAALQIRSHPARKTLLFLPSFQTQSHFISYINSFASDCVILWNLNQCFLSFMCVSELPRNEVSPSSASGPLWHHKVLKPLSVYLGHSSWIEPHF